MRMFAAMSRNHALPLVALALALATAASCKGSRPAPKTEVPPTGEPGAAATARRSTPDDGRLFVMARPEVATMPVPARFGAALPTSRAALAADQLPPSTMLRAGLARGDASVQDRVLAGIAGATARGAIDDDLRAYYVGLFGYSTSEAACAWLRAKMPAAAPPVRDVLLAPLARCSDDASLKALFDAGAPGSLIMEWGFAPGAETALPEDDRFVAAALDASKSQDTFEVRKVGFVLARLGDGAIPAMKQLQSQIADPERRARVAVGMLRHATPAGQAFGKQACKHPVVKEDAMCKPDDPSSLGDTGTGDPTKRSIDEQITYGFDAEELLTRFSRDQVIAGLHVCAADPKRKDYQRSGCLRDLVATDRAAAARLAVTLAPEAETQDLLAQLAAFPDVAAIDARLDALGFTALTPVDPQRATKVVEVRDALANRGRMHWFDVETGQFPNEHDELLGELAPLVGKALDGVIFEEVAPRDHDGGGPYVLHAYAAGKRYRVPAENLGDWYDVGAVLGLLNALLAERGSDQRYLVLDTGDQTAIVVAGPAAGLRALVDLGVLDTGAAGDGAAAGKAFEDKVFQQLQAEGHDVVRDVPISE
jgi:hypothetical protein